MSILKIKDSQGNWVGVPTVKGDTGNGISSAILNDDYTLTLTFTDGTTYKTPSIRGEKGEKGEKGEPATDMEIHICSTSEYDAEIRIPTIANPNDKTFYLVPTEDGTSPDLFTEWVYVNGAWEMFGSAKIDLSNYVTNTDYATANDGGVVKVSGYGLKINASNGIIQTSGATPGIIKSATGSDAEYRPVTPLRQHESTFYGLAKASGDSTQSASSNAVGTYTDEAKASIQTMLGVPSSDDVVSDVQVDGTSIVESGVANIPKAASQKLGVVKPVAQYGTSVNNNGEIYIVSAYDALIKQGVQEYRPIVPYYQDYATFYGLAKAAGHDEKDSTLPVGTYTPEAKSAIKQMLSIADNYDSFIVDVEGTDPTIIGQPSYRYNCGEVLSLTVTPPETGTIDFRFTSGSTPTVLTLPQTVKMPEWWVEVEANTIYEMCITDGVYCGVMSWAM